MPLDGFFFSALAQELKRALTNGRIQAVSQPDLNTVVLQVRQPGHTHKLLISIDAELARLHLTSSTPPNPVTPPAFCLLLRKHLIPGRILGVEQPPYERVLALVIEGQGEDGARSEHRLVAEIMGRHSNLILVDSMSGAVVDAQRRVPAGLNSYREILPGRAYVPPPPQEKLLPSQVSFSDFDAAVRHIGASVPVASGLQRAILGLSPQSAREVLAWAGLDPGLTRSELKEGDVDALWQAFTEMVGRLEAGRIEPAHVSGPGRGEFWCFPLRTVTGEVRRFPTLQELCDWTFSRAEAERRVERLRNRLIAVVERHLERVEKKAALQQDSLDRAEEGDTFKLYADLLTANLYRLGRADSKAGRVSLPNYYAEGAPIDVPLDRKLTPQENAQQYYRRYQKAQKTLEKAREHLQASLEEKAYLESVLTHLQLSDDLAGLEEIESELDRDGYLPPAPSAGGRPGRARPGERASEPRRYRSSDGFIIHVGRNNRQNDALTLRKARPDDVWLHTKEIPGSHVVIEARGAAVPESTLAEAANLAALFSKAKHSANVPVDYTLCRHVRKPRGAKPGMVIYDHQKTLFVTPDAEAAARLEILGPEAV